MMKNVHGTNRSTGSLRLILPVAALLLLAVLCTAPALAAEITIDVPASAATNPATIPVTLHDADDIITFAAQVSNNVDGAVITINSTEPLQGMYAVNSKPEQTTQYVAWMSTEGVTGSAVTLFSIDVLVTDATLTQVPITVTVPELASNAKGMLPAGSYTVKSPATLSITTAGSSANQTPAPTTSTPVASETPGQTETETPTPSETETLPPVETETVPTDIVPGTEQTTQSPGFSVLLIIGAAAAAAALGGKRE